MRLAGTCAVALGALLAGAAVWGGVPRAAHAAAPPTATTTAVAPRPPPALEVAHYKLLQAFNLPTVGKLLAIVGVGVPLILLGAAAYRKTAGVEWSKALYKTYSILNNVPGAGIEEDRGDANFVLNMVHLASLCTFAVLVGIFTQEISDGVEAVRTGNYPLPESGHTVVLGWNSRQSVVLLKEILEAQRQRGPCGLSTPIILLGRTDKAEMDQQLTNEFGDVVNRTIMTRQGQPTRPLDLQRVGAGRARTVIWMVPDTVVGEEEGEQASVDRQMDRPSSLSAALASLHSLRGSASPPQRVVVCKEGASLAGWAESPAGRAVAERLSSRSSQVTPVSDFSNLDAILAQMALQPGLGSVFSEVCAHRTGGFEFYTRHVPSLAGRSFAAARSAFPRATLCGVVDVDSGAARLSPPEGFVLGPRDGCVLLAESEACLRHSRLPPAQAGSKAAPPPPAASSTPVPQKSGGKNATETSVVVLGFGGGEVSRLASNLADFSQAGSRVTLVLPDAPSADEGAKAVRAEFANRKVKGVKFTLLRGDVTSNAMLRRAGVATADAVVLGDLGATCGWRPADADAQVVATTLQLQGFLEGEAAAGHAMSPKPLSVVSCVAEERTTTVLRHLMEPLPPSSGSSAPSRGLAMQVVKAEELMSGMLTQVASDPLLLGTFDQLTSDKGAELYMRGPQLYGVPLGQRQSWGQVQDTVRAQGAVALGYNDASGVIHFGAEKGAPVEFGEGERLVVLAAS